MYTYGGGGRCGRTQPGRRDQTPPCQPTQKIFWNGLACRRGKGGVDVGDGAQQKCVRLGETNFTGCERSDAKAVVKNVYTIYTLL